MAGISSLVRVVDPEWINPGIHVSCIKAQEFDQAVLEHSDRVFSHTREQAKPITLRVLVDRVPPSRATIGYSCADAQQ